MRCQVVPRVPLNPPNPWGVRGANGAAGPVRTHFSRPIRPFRARFGLPWAPPVEYRKNRAVSAIPARFFASPHPWGVCRPGIPPVWPPDRPFGARGNHPRHPRDPHMGRGAARSTPQENSQ